MFKLTSCCLGVVAEYHAGIVASVVIRYVNMLCYVWTIYLRLNLRYMVWTLEMSNKGQGHKVFVT